MPNKEKEDKAQIKKEKKNIINLNEINMNNSQDYFYKNKNFIPLKDSINYNQNNYTIQIPQNNELFMNNNNMLNNNQFTNNFLSQNSFSINDELNLNNNSRIINQNCYQINIENMNIHNSINNISQNYNINTSNANDNDNEINENNKSILSNEYKKDNGGVTNKSSYSNMGLNDLLNNIDKISENQSGCRLLQNKLHQNSNKANDFYRALESKNILKKITIDSFGNYFIQKLLDFITDDIVQDYFTNIIYPNFMEISLNPHGSRVIQKLLDRIYNRPKLMKIFNESLATCLLEIFLNQSSTHIIIKYISVIKYPNNQIIYSFIVNKILYIATHKHSCCTLQKCLEEGNNMQRKEILMSLANISNQLFNDQYGNYAIQFALSLKDEEANRIIISLYLSDFQKNISNKISSNVYEKVLEYCDFNTKQYIIKSLCNFETVKNLLYDTYGNYVLQKTIVVANEPYRSMYIKYIAPLIDGLKNMPNGLIIIHKIISHFPELQNYIQTNTVNNRNYHNANNNLNNNMINNINSINNNSNNKYNINNNYNNFKNADMRYNNKNNYNTNNQYNKVAYHKNSNNFY